ncbi:MAG: hypothetical protein DRQ52_03015 [Gammaproteobacteria bacterium]|nr:MAG: hypothetical protein DRQ52_03015 [Gammaproteobacteria bacterium]
MWKTRFVNCACRSVLKKRPPPPRVSDQAPIDSNPAEAFAQAYNRTLGLIARREHSAAELRRKLASRGYDDAVTQRVLEQLQDRGLQNDAVFAEEYVASKKRRGFGPMKITAELQQHGISRGQISELLAEQDEEWWANCRAAMNRKYGESVAADQRDLQRRSRFLQQRGFTASMVAKVIRENSE